MDLKIGEVNEIGDEKKGKFPEDYYRQLGFLLWVPSHAKHILIVTSRWLWWPFVYKAQDQQFSVVCFDQGWCKKITDATGGWKKIHYLKNTQEIMAGNLGKVDLAVLFAPQIDALPDSLDVGSNPYQTLVEKVYEYLSPGGCIFVGVESWLDILMTVSGPRKVIYRFWERRKCCRALRDALSHVQAKEQISLFPVPFLWRPWLLVGARANSQASQDAISQVGGKFLTRLVRFLPSRVILYFLKGFFPARLWIIRKSYVYMD